MRKEIKLTLQWMELCLLHERARVSINKILDIKPEDRTEEQLVLLEKLRATFRRIQGVKIMVLQECRKNGIDTRII